MGDTESKIRLAIPQNVLNLAIGETTILSDGTPVRRFMRYILQIGQRYVKKGWKGALNITEEYASHLLSEWKRMRADGVAVKITQDHEDRTKAASTMGDQVDFVRQGDWLCSIHDVRGAENIRTAEANKDMSAEIDPVINAGNGKQYHNAIAAITYTPIPVVYGQPIAASLANGIETLQLSMGDSTMDNGSLYCSIAKLAGVDPKMVSDDTAQRHIEDHMLMCKGLKASLAAAEAEVTKLSLAAPSAPDKKYLSLVGKLVDSELARLVDAGSLQKSCSDGWKEFIVGTLEKPSPVLLSLNADDDISAAISKVCKLIGENKPVKVGETTGAQRGLKLSRETPDGDPAPTDNEPKGWEKIYGDAAKPKTATA